MRPVLAICTVLLLIIVHAKDAACAQLEYLPKTNSDRTKNQILAALRRTGVADMADICGAPRPEPSSGRKSARDGCWAIPAALIRVIVTNPELVGLKNARAITIKEAFIIGDIDLGNVKISPAIHMVNSVVDGAVVLERASAERVIEFYNCVVSGQFNALRLVTNDSLLLSDKTRLEGGLNLLGARIGGQLDLIGATVKGVLEGYTLTVNSSLLMRSRDTARASFDTINLQEATIGSALDLTGATVTGPFRGELIKVGASFSARADDGGQSHLKDLSLPNAMIQGNFDASGVIVEGTIDLGGATIRRNLFLRTIAEKAPARFQDVNLRDAVVGGQINISGARISGTFDAESVHVGQHLFGLPFAERPVSAKAIDVRGAAIEGSVYFRSIRVQDALDGTDLKLGRDLWLESSDKTHPTLGSLILQDANIGGHAFLSGTSIVTKFDARNLNIAKSLIFSNDDHDNIPSCPEINLTDARVDGDVNFVGMLSGKEITATGAQIGGSLIMGGEKSHLSDVAKVDLSRVRVKGFLDATGIHTTGLFNLESARVDGDINLGSVEGISSEFDGLSFDYAEIGGTLDMTGAIVDGASNGESVHVKGDFKLRSEADDDNPAGDTMLRGNMNLVYARIDQNVDLRGAVIAGLDFSESTIGGDFEIGSGQGRQTQWKDKNGKPSSLYLRNAQVAYLADEMNSWPRQPGTLHLAGVSIAHLGGFEGENIDNKVVRGMDWWDRWARLDTDYSPSPYVQLASVLTAGGYRDDANEIRYLGREREREALWSRGRYLSWSIATAIGTIAGYGIGTYTFRVVPFVLDLAIVGTCVLWFFVPSQRRDDHGQAWCFGASLSQVLPVIELNKEFSDFFDDPKRRHLYPWQAFLFSVLRVLGWVLGGIVIVAFSGLTQQN